MTCTVAIISNVKVALHVTGDKLHVDPQSTQKTAQHIPRDHLCIPRDHLCKLCITV